MNIHVVPHKLSRTQNGRCHFWSPGPLAYTLIVTWARRGRQGKSCSGQQCSVLPDLVVDQTVGSGRINEMGTASVAAANHQIIEGQTWQFVQFCSGKKIRGGYLRPEQHALLAWRGLFSVTTTMCFPVHRSTDLTTERVSKPCVVQKKHGQGFCQPKNQRDPRNTRNPENMSPHKKQK